MTQKQHTLADAQNTNISTDATTGALLVEMSGSTPGTGATSLGKAEDAAHSSGDVGVMLLAVRKDTAAALAGTDGDYAPLEVDALGRLHVRSLPLSQAAAAANVHAPASNTAAVVTYAAGGAGVSHAIAGVAWSYSGAPTSGNLKIEDGSGTTVFSIDITAAGPGFIPFPVPLRGSANTALIVTLAAGGSGVSGKVSVLSKWTE